MSCHSLRAYLHFLSARDGNCTAQSPGVVACWIETVRMARPDLVVMGRAGNQRWLVSFGKTREWKASLEKDCVNGVNLAPSAGDFSALLWELGAVSRAGRKTLISRCQQTNLIFCACTEHVPFNVPHSPMGARGR